MIVSQDKQILQDNHQAIVAHDPQYLSNTQVDVLKNTLCKHLSDDEFKIFTMACQSTRLNPFLKQIYAIKRGNNLTIQTGIDGFRLIADRSGKYMPGEAPKFETDDKGKLIAATAYVKKCDSAGQWHTIAATAYMEEYHPGHNQMWNKMPRTMIAKCAESLALRKAFPAELSGLYTEEEMQQAAPCQAALQVDITSETVEIRQTITADEAKEIASLLQGVDENYRSFCVQHMQKLYGAPSVENLTRDNYENLKKKLIARKAAYQKKVQDGEL